MIIETASIAIFNHSTEILYLDCNVLEGTHFYEFPETFHEFQFSSDQSSAMDGSVDIKNSDSDSLAVSCYQEWNPANSFTYRAKNAEESVSAYGQFHYDKDYLGALEFNVFNTYNTYNTYK